MFYQCRDRLVVDVRIKMIKIQNVVATAEVGCSLPLTEICMHLPDAVYNPSRFKAVIWRMRNPRTTLLIFASGKIVITGAKTEEENLAATHRLVRRLKRQGIPGRLVNHRVQMIASSYNMERRVNIVSFQAAHRAKAKLEPEIFAGVVYKMPNATALVFHTGKGILTGAKSTQEVMTMFDLLCSDLEPFLY